MKPDKNSILRWIKDTLSRLATGYRKLHREIRSRKEAEAALANSEDKFRVVFESANVGKSITYPTGEINVNQAFCDMLDYTREELKDKKWQDITPPDEFETTQKVIDQLLQGKKDSVRFNKRYMHKNGSYIWADVSTVIHRDIHRKPLFFITTIIDITEHKRIADALRESELRLRTFLDASLDMAFLKDDSYRHLIANSSLCKFYGKTESEIIGKTDFDLMTEKDAASCRKTDEQTLLSNALLITEEVVGGRCYETMKFPVKLVEGKKGIGAYIRDITERKRAEEAVQHESDFIKAATDSLPGLFYILDENSKFLLWNDNFEKRSGYSADEISGMSALDFFETPEREVVAERIKETFTSKESAVEANFISKDRIGTLHYFTGKYFTFEGKPCLIGMGIDITERKQIEQALRESEDLFRNLFHRHTAVKLLIDPENGQIVDANDAAANFYGWTCEQLVSMKIQDINILPAEDVKEAMERVEKMERTRFEFRHRRADGSIRDVEVFSGKIKVKGNVLLHSIINDITDKKCAEEAILILNEDLEQKVNERTAELKKTIAQLEELNRAFVGRELKMVELKERIVELEKKEK